MQSWKDRVRKLRGKLGLSQERFALLVGASLVSVNRWEGGHAEPTAKAPDLEMLEAAVAHHGAEAVCTRLLRWAGDEVKRRAVLVKLAQVGPPSSRAA